MPEVRAERFIGAPPAKVYALAKDLEGLKPYLKEVESLKVLSQEGHRTKSEWVAVAMGKKVRWAGGGGVGRREPEKPLLLPRGGL
jgi:uncharacterized membrane protein